MKIFTEINVSWDFWKRLFIKAVELYMSSQQSMRMYLANRIPLSPAKALVFSQINFVVFIQMDTGHKR